MMTSVLDAILLQANTLSPKLEDFPNLNELLQSTFLKWSWPSLSFTPTGGLGEDYLKIESFLTLNDEQKISAIDADNLFKFAQEINIPWNDEAEYKAGLCFALVAVYAEKHELKNKAYRELKLLFIHEEGLPNKKFADQYKKLNVQCKQNLVAIPLTQDFFPTQRIINSWELEASTLLSFEAQRQKAILGSYAVFSIRKAFLLLGVKDEDLNKGKIDNAYEACIKTLTRIFGSTFESTPEQSLIFKRLKEAKELLQTYVQFKNFNYDKKFAKLRVLIEKAREADISAVSTFGEVYQTFRDLDVEIKTMVSLVSTYKDSAYITDEMIYDKLRIDPPYTVEKVLESLAQQYYQIINEKIDSLILKADSLNSSSTMSPDIINAIQKISAEVENARTILMELKGFSVAEFNLLSTLFAHESVTAKSASLDQLSKNLQSKLEAHAVFVKASAQLNEDLKDKIPALVERYKKATLSINNILQEKNSLTFSWQENMTAILEESKSLTMAFEDINKNFSVASAEVTESERLSIKDLYDQKSIFAQATVTMEKKIQDAYKNTINYLMLKDKINHEIRLYLSGKSKHHQDRYDSINRLVNAMQKIDGNDGAQRFSQLLNALEEEQIKTVASQKKIGFLGQHRVCRLDTMYDKILLEACYIPTCDSFQKEVWAKVPHLNIDTLNYMMLKKRLQEAISLYKNEGAHHQDRHLSLARLEEKIAVLDADTQVKSRFEELLTQIKSEQTETSKSHAKVGFFGSWRPSRLETLYAEIIESAGIKNLFNTTTTVHESTTSNSSSPY